MDELQINRLLDRCRKHDRLAQKALYKEYYNYGMTICSRYATDLDDAKEIFNDGFMKVFKNLDKYSPDRPFKFWLKRILVNTSIDRWRQLQKRPLILDITKVAEPGKSDHIVEHLSYQDLMKLVQKLPPAYKMVFTLYVVEGFKHAEIAEKLNIKVGTSKSNLVKARLKLQGLITKNYGQLERYGS